MKMDGRSLLAVVLCFVGFVLYQEYLKSKYPHLYQPRPKAAQTETQASTEGTGEQPAAAPASKGKVASEKDPSEKIQEKESIPEDFKKLSSDQLKIETANRLITFDQNLSAITSIKLKDYKEIKKEC